MSQSAPFQAKVLVVDDLIENIQVVGAILASEGYDVYFAKSGQEAIDIVAEQPLDLILLDVMMPGMNGFQAAREIKQLPGRQAVPIIFLTALTEKEEVIQGFEAGAVDFVSKPFHRNELLARVKTHIVLEKTLRDLGEKNDELERVANQLSQANAARNKFFSILAHDLKNPFNGLLGLLEEIVRTFDTFAPGDLREILKSLNNSSKNVYNLLLTLLEWGKTQTGGLTLEPGPISLFNVVDEITGALENNLAAKKLSFKHNLLAPTIWGDPGTVGTILRNLVSNAVKFTPEGGSITVSSQETGRGYEIEVRDTGMGIKPQTLEKLFRLDTKVTTLGTNRETGTGLGLILCKEFAEKNGGTLEVETEVGKGSCFRLVLPSLPAE